MMMNRFTPVPMPSALTINRVALGSIKRRKGQYKAMILGAGLAIFFVSSLFFAVQSVYETYRLNHVGRVGSQDMIVFDAERVTLEALIGSGLVSDVGSVHVIGETEDSKCPIGYYDEPGAEMAGRRVSEGRLPQAVGEIAVEPNFLQKLRSEAKVGDELVVKLKIPVGKNAQFLPDPVEKTYQLVGILKPQSPYLVGNYYSDWEYLHYPSAIVSSAEQVELGGRAIVHRMVKLARGARWGEVNGFTGDEYDIWMNLHTEFSMLGGDVSNAQFNTEGIILTAIALILGTVLILAASLGVMNAFAGSLSQRRNQIGMMRAVGATSRQIRSIFGREALLLALLIAPVSIALSYGFVWLLTRWIGSVSFYANPWFLPIDLAASLICVALAAWVPLHRASKLPPMQAIRDVSLLRARKRVRIRQKPQYDAPRLIASRHLSLYRTRQMGIAAMVAVSMLIISIVLPYMSEFWLSENPYGYQVMGFRWNLDPFVETNMTPHMGLGDADVSEVLAMPLVQDVDVASLVQVNMLMDEVTPYAWNMRGQNYWGDPQNPADEADQAVYRLMQDAQHPEKKVVPTDMLAVEDDLAAALAPHVLEGRIDLKALNAGREVLIIAPTYYVRKVRTEDGHTTTREFEPFENQADVTAYPNDMYHAGDTLGLLRLFTRGGMSYTEDDVVDYVTGIEREEATVTIGAVLDKDAFRALTEITSYWSYTVGELVTTRQGLSAMGIEAAGYPFMGVKLSGTPDDDTHAYLTDQLKGIAARGSELQLVNNIQSARDMVFWKGVFEACSLAVILLMMSMCVSLVNSAITNRVRSEKRAIGTLRAVGAGMTDIVRSYRLQALAMVGFGVLAGLALSVAFLLWFYWINSNAKISVGPISAAQLAFLAAVALFCGINLSFRIREITKDSIVANIREL